MKLSDTAAGELPLNDERLPEARKQNRHVVIALNHLRKRRGALEVQDKAIQEQLVEIDAAIAALE